MMHTNLFVGPYAATISFVKEFTTQEEKEIQERLIMYVNTRVPLFDCLALLIEEDIECNVPEGCTELDALMAAVTFRLSENDWHRPI